MNINSLVTFAVKAGTNQVDDAKYRCKYGCCGYDHYGCKCCSYAGESQGLDTEAMAKKG
jgi:hypothetical protein